MDMLILGLLMIKRHTVYDIRNIVRQFFQSMCSDSMGSIRSAVQKLLEAELVTVTEYVERSVNKRKYAITDKGRQQFLEWLHTPANLSLPKNIELAKLLNMGFVATEERARLFDEMILLLESTLSRLQGVQSAIQIEEGKATAITYWEADVEYLEGIKKTLNNPDVTQLANAIGDFQMLSLQYEIDITKFQIEWFRKLRNQQGI